MAKAYVIRAQGLGLIYDKVYLSPPSKEDLEKVLSAELARHGFDAEGNPRSRWVQVQEVELDEEVRSGPAPSKVSGKLSKKDADDLKKGMAPFKGAGEAPSAALATTGTGTVTNPGEAEPEKG